MAIKSAFLFCSLVVFALAGTEAVKPSHHSSIPFNRSSFPSDFIFGAGSAAHQVEGAALQYGRGPSIWDTFTRKYPAGKVKGGVNQQGVHFYNNLINDLLSNGLIPFVTLFHWDLPQALEDEYGGFLSDKIVEDFQEYADFVFKTFGDRVKHWVTVNEPNIFTISGYNGGTFAPGRCSNYVGNCTSGDSATEPYIVGHHILLAHAAAVKLYKEKYQASQKGRIGITLVTRWYEPKYKTDASRKAASRAVEFSLGWFLHPITYGEYPSSMRSILGSRLPKFTKSQSKTIKGSLDFLGMNYYTTNYAEPASISISVNHSYNSDIQATLTTQKNGVSIGKPTTISWFVVYPRGIRELMLYIKDQYKNPPVYITENGVPEPNNNIVPIKEALKDITRIRYLHGHLFYLLKSVKDGVNVKGYYVWAFHDNFEWASGYTIRFGLTFIDYKNNLKRHLKYSALWLKMFLLN
ncbi:hypothetical protein FNV43_RR07239 [Rhamnella rubrinervis]|uniref:Vicianin hydrolase-like n=1 Tax=Rhamnella rubrinervis TaxID=2594499 RepID=A0A8K0MMI5_9ROSA|nr:hypothetical protein FNV43_RR07239 [Rhamnella rubrinervis]